MTTAIRSKQQAGLADDLVTRVAAFDWPRLSGDLDAHGWALLSQLLARDECAELASLYDSGHFRSTIVMARHGFGRGEYKYFAYPLPATIAALRPALYAQLAPLANRWNEAMGIAVRYPQAHADFIERCHKAGQTRPTPLLLPTAKAITIVCIRISTASTFSRSRS
jgi:hypothetical protein